MRKQFPNKTIWCYSGYLFDKELLSDSRARCECTDEMLSMIDVLVDGEFVEALHDISLAFRGSSNQRIIDVKIRVLGRGGDEGHAAVLDALQQALLLLFVQVLDLVQIQQDAARPRQRADVLEHRLDVAGAAGGAVELVEGHAAVLRNDAGHGGLAGAGGAVEDHVGDAAALDGAAEHPPRSQQMLLPAHIRQRFGTQALRKWFIHGGFPFPARKALFI